ncbi:tetratricopeptide repeat protein [Hoeflea sp.]|uniref:tetratricopeptide repeat protein n=1 Tax=Hoeflea sp. TaxID=1940281 RepID=UPI003A942F89
MNVPLANTAYGLTALGMVLAMALPAKAEIETGRVLMESHRFEEAMEEFLPAARSGNADAEELIGVMYAMGLGVERDDERAFEWYLRASMKGHPGAQSGIGWYFEVGRGTAVDLVRAYLWYGLSAIGGDPDAAISIEEVAKKMTPEQIRRAEILINDYRPWMYPFR